MIKKSNIKSISGLTFTETIIAVFILSIIAIPISYFLVNSIRSVTKSQLKVESQEELRRVFSKIEPYLMEANEVLEANVSSITFICDSNMNPSYNLYGDIDGDSIPNIQDPDDDNDAIQALLLPTSAQWRVGYDLKDDDDDNDNAIDVRIRFFLSGKNLYQSVSYNGSPWSDTLLNDKITTFSLTYFGSKREKLGELIDLGNDGVSGTGDAGENDGLITQREIDWVQPPLGHGNRNGRLDTKEELRYIVSIYMEIGIDKNKDGIEDYKIRTEIAPPLLTVKRIP